MNKLLKIIHLLGLALFLGSIFGHILLGNLADPSTEPAGFAALMQAKHMNVLTLTMPGLMIILLSGIALMLRFRMTPKRFSWMAVKLVLVVLVALNGVLFLAPISRDMAMLAQDAMAVGSLSPQFYLLQQKEELFGIANLLMILAVVYLSVAKPKLRSNKPA